MNENGVKAMKHFAAEIDVSAITVKDIVEKLALPTERMTHGRAKGLSPKTQRDIKRILGIKPKRKPVTAA